MSAVMKPLNPSTRAILARGWLSPDWADSPPCRDLTDLFYIDQGGDRSTHYTQARSICATCPVQPQCLAACLMEEGRSYRKQRYGFRAGLTPSERYELARELDLPTHYRLPA